MSKSQEEALPKRLLSFWKCVLYHLGGCGREGVSRAEIVEAVKVGTVAVGSLGLLNARFACAMSESASS